MTGGRAVRTFAIVAVLAATATTASAIDDRAATPLERGAFVAIPAVYDLVMDQPVDAIVVNGRRIAVGRPVEIRGTAFGVAPGRVVTARHVVSPDRETLLDEIATMTGVALPSGTATVRIIAGGPRSITLTPAHTATDPLAASAPHITARIAQTSDAVDDLVLLAIPDRDAPTLVLNDTLTRGVPASVIGFGSQPRGVPAARAGTLDGPRVVEGTDNDGFGGFEGEVLRGDSGAPVVDADGQAHGVVLRRRTSTTPVIARAESVRDLLAEDGATPVESAATNEFRSAMDTFWQRDYQLAATNLTLLSDAQPANPVIRHEQARATALQDAPYTLRIPSRRRGLILAIGTLATLSAAALGAIRIRRQPLLP